MKRGFSDEQIIGMIKEYEAFVKGQELHRRYGISYATFYIYGCLSRGKVSSVLMWWRFHGCKHLSGVAGRMARPNGNPAW